MCSKSQLNLILNSVASKANEVFTQKLDSVILYGSYARGDYDNESDIDIMILADIAREEIAMYKKPFLKLSGELGLENDIVITITLKDIATFNKYLNAIPFYQAVEREGVRIAV